jgi:hypothetical protein
MRASSRTGAAAADVRADGAPLARGSASVSELGGSAGPWDNSKLSLFSREWFAE